MLKRVKELLAEADARAAARHITLVDCTVGTQNRTTTPDNYCSRSAFFMLCCDICSICFNFIPSLAILELVNKQI